jgi:hypothetical protein
MIRLPRQLCAVAILSIVATQSLHAQDDTPTIVAKARAIHNKVIKIDTHVDFSPRAMTDTTPNYVTGTTSQVDLPKMESAGLDAVFFSIYVGQAQDFTPAGYKKALDGDLEKFDAVHRLAEKLAPNRIEIAYTAADVRRIIKSGKKVALMGVENGYGIGEDITNVKKFYDRGARSRSRTTGTTSSPTATPAKPTTSGSGTGSPRSASRSWPRPTSTGSCSMCRTRPSSRTCN